MTDRERPVPGGRFTMPATVYRGTATEAEWMASLIEAAMWHGWRVALRIEDALYREVNRVALKPSVRAALAQIADWPDVMLVQPRRHRTLFVETKTDKKSSRLSAGQRDRIALLVAGGNDVRVWRPADYDGEVDPVLAGREPTATRGRDEARACFADAALREGWA